MHATLRCCELINLRQKTPITPEKKPLKIPEAFNEAANKLLPDGPCYIGLAPGAGHPTRPKKWPIENFLKLAVMQVKLGRTPVFFLGPDEHHWITMINASVPKALMPEITNPTALTAP